ncbi:24260_t:CDS:1, partial [Dentiscutata erythropus]
KFIQQNAKEKKLRQNNSQATNINEIESDNDLQDIKNKFQVKSSGIISLNEIDKESISNIELEEKRIALLERKVKLKKELAKANAIELQNRQLKKNLGLP